MRRKDLIFYTITVVLVALLAWQVVLNSSFKQQLNGLSNQDSQIHLIGGIGPLGSTHIHADVKVYINGNALDFSQKKYQLATSFIHFEEGVGDVVHVHATGMTVGHLFKSLRGGLSSNCVVIDGVSYCNENDKKLKFYVNGNQNNEFDNYEFHDLDKLLVSYGKEDSAQLQKQLESITNLAPRYRAQK